MKKIYFIIFQLFLLNTAFSQTKMDLFDIARKGNLEQIKEVYLANPNALLSINENGFSPLIIACYHNNYDIAKFLIDHQSNINSSSPMGSPLMAAVVKGNVAIAKLLLENKADVNSIDPKGTTALMYAVMFKNSDLVQLLLQYKADKTKKDNTGKTAFEYAVFSGNETIINLLK